jgi:hypothetical protein
MNINARHTPTIPCSHGRAIEPDWLSNPYLSLSTLVSGGVATRTGGKFNNVVVGLGGASGSDIRATGPNVGLQQASLTQDDGSYCTTHRHSPPAQLVRVGLQPSLYHMFYFCSKR